MILHAIAAVLAFHMCPRGLNTPMLVGVPNTCNSHLRADLRPHIAPLKHVAPLLLPLPVLLPPPPPPSPPPFPCPSVLLHAVSSVLALHHVDLQLILLVTPQVAVTHEEKCEVVRAGRSGCVELQLDLRACVGWRKGREGVGGVEPVCGGGHGRQEVWKPHEVRACMGEAGVMTGCR